MEPTKLRAIASSFPRLVQTPDDSLRAFLRDRLGEDFDVSLEQGQKVRDILKTLCQAIAEGGELWDRVTRAHAIFCPAPEMSSEQSEAPLPRPTFMEARSAEPRVSPWAPSAAAAAPAPPSPDAPPPDAAQSTPQQGMSQPLAAHPAPDETIALGGLSLQSPLPFKEGSQALAPPTVPARSHQSVPQETETTLAHTGKPEGAPLPFVAPADRPGWDEERTVRVSAPAPAGRASPPADATQAFPAVNVTLEHLAALQVELQAYPSQRAAVLAKYGLPSEAAYKAVDQMWGGRFLTNPAILQRYQQLLAHYRSHLPRRGA